MEDQSLEFHLAVREGYLEIAKKEPDRVMIFDARDPFDENFKKILKRIRDLIKSNDLSRNYRARKR